MPMILPNISSVDLTEDTRTSTTRLCFSSITADITMLPNIVTNMKMMIPSTMEMMEYTPASDIFSLPLSSTV